MSMRPEPSVCELANPGRGSGDAAACLEEPPPPLAFEPEASACRLLRENRTEFSLR